MDWNFGMDARSNVANVEPGVARLKAMNDRYSTSGRDGTRVGKYTRNGNHRSCVGEDQDDFGVVKQASSGTSKADQGMESNDGPEMDQEWAQLFEMMERAELSEFAAKSNLEYGRVPSGRPARSNAKPNLTHYTGSVRSALCNRSFKNNTKAYNHSPTNHATINRSSYSSEFRPFKDNTQSFYSYSRIE